MNAPMTDDLADRGDAELAAPAPEALRAHIDAACGRIAPLWPLQHFVAVNPFFGLRDESFQEASDTLARITGAGLYMPRAYYRAQLASGRIAREDIATAIRRCDSSLDPEDVERALATEAPRPKLGMAAVSEVLERVEGGLWSSFVTERISLHCAAYFDLGQATIRMPWRKQTLFASWRGAAAIDRSPSMMGLSDFRSAVTRLPEDPYNAIALAIRRLNIPAAAVERYLHASLMSINGWAAWARYLRWLAELQGGRDDSIVDLLAIRLMWDMLLYEEKRSAALVARWREMLAASMRPPSAKRQASAEIDRILLTAMEVGFQRSIIAGLAAPAGARAEGGPMATAPECPAVQAAFCIDVRSEVFRRALETVASPIQTLGFAGFFGIFIEHVPLGSTAGHVHVPVLFQPTYPIYDRVKDRDPEAVIVERRRRIGLYKAWKGFKFSAASCFSFVEATGLMYASKLITDSFGWTRPVPDPRIQGLDRDAADRVGPTLDDVSPGRRCPGHTHAGIPPEERAGHAERILRAMSLTGNFAPIVLLAGHGSSTVNNPYGSALDCGACAGQTGEASARVVAALLNDRAVREDLRRRGIDVPDDTWFLAGLHDTTTDALEVFECDEVPPVLAPDLARLRQWLEQAADLARLERAALLGIAATTDRDLEMRIRDRSRDWSQVRPEWALANNAAFIAAPRSRTAALPLAGRAFLHEYVWREDAGFGVLELIMTAPMVVANWINMQYYASVVDNRRFGSGNKVLHNVAGGAIGVLEGNGGDLRIGLPLQSLRDGRNWMHEPLRLSVFIEAPQDPIDHVLSRHAVVRELVENGWLHLFRIDDDGTAFLRRPDGRWQDTERERPRIG